MQIAYSQYGEQDVVVAANFSAFPEGKFSLTVLLRNDDRLEIFDPRDIIYSSKDYPSLDWTSIATVIDFINRIALPVSNQFIIDLSNEKERVNRNLKIIYSDDDMDIPF